MFGICGKKNTKKELSDLTANEILTDLVDYKLVMAKYYLQKIDSSVPLDYGWKHFVLESNSESFLFFCNMVVEILAREINTEFKLIPEDKFDTQTIEKDPATSTWNNVQRISGGLFFEDLSIYKVKKKLQTSDILQKKVYDIINRYLQDPVRVTGGWDLSKSNLWLLRELRNHIAHSPIINRIAFRGNGNRTSFLFRFTVENPNPASATPGLKIGIVGDNPQAFFSNLFNDLMQFTEEIRQIIPYKCPSYQYKNPISFEM